MAETRVEVDFNWENDNFLTVRSREDVGDWVTIITIEENAHINEMWGPIEQICRVYCTRLIERIGKEMKA